MAHDKIMKNTYGVVIMEKAHKIIIGLLVVTLCAVLIFGFSVYSKLSERIDGLYSQISSLRSQVNDVSYKVSSIKDDIQDAIEEESSIISSYSAVQGNMDESYCRDITFTVSPKQYTESTTATLYVGGREILMQKNGAMFSVTASFPVNEIYKSYSFAFETDGIVTMQKVDDFLDCDVGHPYFGAYYTGSYSVTKNSINVNNSISIYNDSPESAPSSARVYIADENGNVLWEKDCTGVVKEAEIEVNKTFKNAKFLYFYSEYTNKYGLRFEECFFLMSGDGENGEFLSAPTVYYPDGTKLEWVYFE